MMDTSTSSAVTMDESVDQLPISTTPVSTPSTGLKTGSSEPRPPVPGGEGNARLFNETASKGSLSSQQLPSTLMSQMSSSTPAPAGVTSPVLTVSRRASRTSRHSAHHPHASPQEQVTLSSSLDPPVLLGSVQDSSEATSTPPFLRWAESLRFLLQDIEGVRLFKQYLEQEHCSNTLDFWFACQGFKYSVDPSDTQKIYQLIKVIYRTYIRGETAVCIQPETRKDIYEKISKKQGLDQTIFDAAQAEVETLMRNTTYPAFLKSDLYVSFVQSGGESPSRPLPSTPPQGFVPPPASNSLPPSGLPTLDEERELRSEELTGPRLPHSASFGGVPSVTPVHPSSLTSFPQQHSSAPGTPHLQHTPQQTTAPAPLTTENLLVSRFYRAELSRRPETLAGTYLQSPEHARKPPNPYHVSYAPVSTQDSELQSLSSDAHTDETLSLTDSSVDGGHAHSRKHWKHQRRAMRRSAAQNRDTALHHSLIPRNVEQRERPLPKERNIAEVDPAAFARLLTEKLERVIEEQAKMEKINKLFHEQVTVGEEHAAGFGGPRGAVPRNRLEAWAGRIMAAARMAPLHVDAQDILEDHCSRIWEKSAEQTPAGARSPPEHPLRPSGPSGSVAAAAAHAVAAAAAHASVRGIGSSRASGRRPPPDVASQFSYDSGVTADFPGSCSLGGSEVAASISMGGVTSSASVAATAAGLTAGSGASGTSGTTELAHHRHVHHYHYHHHYEPSGSAGPGGPERVPPGQSGMVGGPVSHGGGHISAESYEAIDSGVSCVYDVPPAMARASTSASASGPTTGGHHSTSSNEATTTSNEKVLAWIIGSDPSAAVTSRSHKQHKMGGAAGSVSSGGGGTTSGRGNKSSASVPSTGSTSAHGSGPAVSGEKKSRSSSLTQTTTASGLAGPVSSAQRSGPQAASSPRAATAELSREPSVSNASTLSNRSERSGAANGRSGLSRTSASGCGIVNQQGPGGVHSSTVSAPGSVVSGGSVSGGSGDYLVVGYYLCGDPVPYRIQWQGRQITLGQFKSLIAKKGNYRYFFKKACDEFETGVVKEEINNDDEILPLWEGKVVAKVERMD